MLVLRGLSESLLANLAPDELWRSFPRLKRTVIGIVLLSLTCVFTFIIASPFIKIADDASKDILETALSVGPTNERQQAVVNAFKHAWEGYRKYAWGHDQLKPISGGYSDWFDTGLTIVDALDTAIIMGLKEEVAQGTEWIRNSLTFEKDRYVNLFETTIRTLGGLLSAYHLTGDRMFVAKAQDLADRLMGAFTKSKSAIPLSDVNLKTRLFDDYKTAMESMKSKLYRYSEPSQLGFVGELLPGEIFSPKMDHLVCFLAGTLALGSKNGAPDEHMKLAQDLGRACQAMYKNPTGLGPEIAYFNMMPGVQDDLSIKPLDAHSLLRPEAIEAWFYLYRLTGDKTYQSWGWEAFTAIEKYARVKNGYSSVKSVKRIPVTHSDLMESFFLAETLKYLYLLFADDQTSLFPLDKWVFNTEAHPLPIYSS
ncbi:glycosyl hydrolase family 47 [Teladorsagia circumcincta]|uniref:alpha-1,2-Mannosidase n=1 Tax=Teladorsagia circumcincta TaxID=45464 RepID=A0A2G9UDH4_TELCI|nr:glycosyl hydrolase family 47 [Teladorsagia circumcincta]